MIYGETTVVAEAGMAKFDGIAFTGAPGSTFRFGVDGDGIDETKPSN